MKKYVLKVIAHPVAFMGGWIGGGAKAIFYHTGNVLYNTLGFAGEGIAQIIVGAAKVVGEFALKVGKNIAEEFVEGVKEAFAEGINATEEAEKADQEAEAQAKVDEQANDYHQQIKVVFAGAVAEVAPVLAAAPAPAPLMLDHLGPDPLAAILDGLMNLGGDQLPHAEV